MKCINCNKEFESKRSDAKYCSAKCRVSAGRKLPGVKIVHEEVKQKEIEMPHGHWFGKPPHKPIFTDCLKEDCPQENNAVPDWEPTCKKPCCV